MSTNVTSTGSPAATNSPALSSSSAAAAASSAASVVPTSSSADRTTSTTAPAETTSSTSVSSSSLTSLSSVTTISTTSTTPTTSSSSSLTSSTIPPTTSTTSSSSAIIPTTSTTPSTTSSYSSITTSTGYSTSDGVTSYFTVTQTLTTAPDAVSTGSTTSTSSAGATSTTTSNSSTGLNNSGRIAVAVVVPIAGVALLILAGIYLWRKYKQRKEAEEERRKEVEEYGYNPNADPTIPPTGSGGPFEIKEDTSSGYRGWGTTTLAGSTGRKASTTLSGGAAGGAYSDAPSPTRANYADTRSGEGIGNESGSPEGEILGAMGPSAAGNRNSDVHRGPSNASSSYSAANRSDGSGDGGIGVAYGGGPGYYDQYGNPGAYNEGAANGRPGAAELSGQPVPVIRDVAARRNTRIENPAHFPQQSAGISQNF